MPRRRPRIATFLTDLATVQATERHAVPPLYEGDAADWRNDCTRVTSALEGGRFREGEMGRQALDHGQPRAEERNYQVLLPVVAGVVFLAMLVMGAFFG